MAVVENEPLLTYMQETGDSAGSPSYEPIRTMRYSKLTYITILEELEEHQHCDGGGQRPSLSGEDKAQDTGQRTNA